MTTTHDRLGIDRNDQTVAPWSPSGDGLPTYQQLIAGDRVPPAERSILRDVTFSPDLGSFSISKESYYSRDYFERENAAVWQKVWQPVCHVSQVREPGEIFVYDVVGLSALITRTEVGTLKAYHNSCPHRGTELRTSTGRVRDITCPFHGFSWALDGTFLSMPCSWDFEHVDKSTFRLSELQVDTWAGFIFINPDLEAPRLRDFLGDIVDHFEPWGPEDRVPVLHLTQSLEANWKVATEAFLETFHIVGVHRQALARSGDTNAQYDIYPPHVTRMIVASNVPSAHLGDSMSEQDVLDAIVAQQFHGVNDGQRDGHSTGLDPAVLEHLDPAVRENPMSIPEGWTARSVLAELARAQVRVARGDEVADDPLCDAEVGDAIHYTVFPSFSILGGYGFGNVFWFRPVVDDPERCELEFFITRPGRHGEVDAPAPMREARLESGDTWLGVVPELGGLGILFDQDSKMMIRQQKGLHSQGRADATLLAYSESRIRSFRATLEEYLAG